MPVAEPHGWDSSGVVLVVVVSVAGAAVVEEVSATVEVVSSVVVVTAGATGSAAGLPLQAAAISINATAKRMNNVSTPFLTVTRLPTGAVYQP